MSAHFLKNGLISEQLEFNRNVRAAGLKDSISLLRMPNVALSVFSLLFDWSLVGASIYAALKIPWVLPISILLIGSRQRALSNLVHDASHGNLFKSRMVNDWLGNLFAALPMFETVRFYRRSHRNHHRHLGSEILDPDLLSHRRYGYSDVKPDRGFALRIYFKLIFNFRSFCDSVFGGLFRIKYFDFHLVLFWWTAFAGGLVIVAGGVLTSKIVLLWVFSRMTGYHFIRVFAEFLDHTGLKVGGISSFTRNISGAGKISFLLHPHSDTYHLVHHLMPGVPHYNLRKAHDFLLNAGLYNGAHNCSGYFQGDHSAIECWMGRCEGDFL